MELESTELYQAITKGDINEVRRLLASGVRTSARDSKGRCMLHVASEAKASAEILKELLTRVDIITRDLHGNTVADLVRENKQRDMEKVLKASILEASLEKLEALAMSGSDLWPVTDEDIKTMSGEKRKFMEDLPNFQKKVSDLHKAIEEGSLSEVKKLADGKMMHAADGTGLPPIHKAIILNHADIVIELAKSYKECLSIVDNMKRSALHYAGGCHDAGYLYQELMNEGADDTVIDMMGKTPKDYFDDPEQLSVVQEKKRMLQILERIEKRKQEAKKTNSPTQNGVSGPQPTTVDGIYVAQHLGTALTLALADIAERRPWDPIEYLANWLYRYKETINFVKKQEDLLSEIQREETARLREAEERKKRKREEKAIHEDELKKEKEIEEEEKRKEQEELQRKSKDAAFARRPSLETVKEEGEEDSSAREKDENGQTELHKLASQQGTDLSALIRLGYSIADRDANNKTPRDIASDSGVTENVTAIDKHIQSMVEAENTDSLQQLVLDGYDGLMPVLETIDRNAISEDMRLSLDTITSFQDKINEVFQTVQKGSVRDVRSALTRKKLVEAKDKYGRCVLHIAVLTGKEDVVDHIATTYPSSLKYRDNMNRTPLHYAMGISQTIADMLISHGADQNYKDVKQRTPSYYSNNPEEILSLRETLPPLPEPDKEQEISQVQQPSSETEQSPADTVQAPATTDQTTAETEQAPAETEQSAAD